MRCCGERINATILLASGLIDETIMLIKSNVY